MNYTDRDKFLDLVREAVANGTFVRLTLGAPRGRDPDVRNVIVRPVTLKEGPRLQFVYGYRTRDITKNFPADESLTLLDELCGAKFLAGTLQSTARTAAWQSHRGFGERLTLGPPVHDAPPSTAHDRPKQHALDARQARWLNALGVTTANGHVREGMSAKFRQIQKFTELLEHLWRGIKPKPAPPVTLVDMGCGKGYLTFAAAELLRRLTNGAAQVRGIEARPELVEQCNRVARESGLTGLTFEAGDIAGTELPRADIVIALHACDTATDDAIAKGIAAGAVLIVVSPCCHKEVRPQLQPPPVLQDALRHGILQERQAEFVTDALRAALLEWAGYDTKVFEFVSTDHTAKNLMIAGIKRPGPARRDEDLRKVRELAASYGIGTHRLAAHLGVSLVADGAPAA